MMENSFAELDISFPLRSIASHTARFNSSLLFITSPWIRNPAR